MGVAGSNSLTSLNVLTKAKYHRNSNGIVEWRLFIELNPFKTHHFKMSVDNG